MPLFKLKSCKKTKDLVPAPTATPATTTEPAADIIISRDKEIADIINAMMIKVSSMIQSNVKIQAGDVAELVANIMELVEQINRPDLTIKGSDKAFIANQVASRSLDLIPGLNDSDKSDIRALIPNMIEVIIKATHGDIPINLDNPLRTDGKIDTVALAKKVYDKLKTFIVEKKFDAQTISINIIIIIGYIISILNEYKTIAITDKKQIVNQTIQYLTADLPVLFPDISPNNLQIARTALVLAPSLIDAIILAAGGLLNINAIKQKAASCFACRK